MTQALPVVTPLVPEDRRSGPTRNSMNPLGIMSSSYTMLGDPRDPPVAAVPS
jgi:hypothetical protein